MGLFARAATKGFNQGLGTIAAGAHIIDLTGWRSTSGIRVTTDNALGYTAYWAAVRILSETVAQLPFVVYEDTGTQGKRKATDHFAYNMLHYRANPTLTAFRWRETAMAHLCTWGNHFSMVARDNDGRGRAAELWPLAPERMEVELLPTGQLEYTYTRVNGNRETLDPRDLLHLIGLSWDGLTGMSPLRYLRNAIGLGIATAEHGARFFDQGAHASFVITHPKGMTDKAFAHLKEQIDSGKVGVGNAWKPWVLEEGMEPHILSMPNDDAQWLETRQEQVLEVARAFRIHPYKLAVNAPGAVSYASVEQAAIDFHNETMGSWYQRFEQDVGMQLMDETWQGAGGTYYPKLNPDAFLRGDLATRTKAHNDAINGGWKNRNEAREDEDMAPVEGLDSFLVPTSMSTVNPDGTITSVTLGTQGQGEAGAEAGQEAEG